MMRGRKGSLCLCSILVAASLAFTGCQEESTAISENAGITLLEPANTEVTYEAAAYRNLYSAETYGGTVVPYVEEYAPQVGMQFLKYGAYPGEAVAAGRELIASNTDAIDKQIESKQEYIQSKKEAYEEYMEAVAEELKLQLDRANTWKYYVDSNEANRPEQFIQTAGGQVENPEYTKWLEGYTWVSNEYRVAKHAYDTAVTNRDNYIELYELELKHEEYLLKRLQESRQGNTVTSEMAGTIVAMRTMSPGNWMNAEEPVAAVANLSHLQIKCDYIIKTTVSKAQDIYALINGKRYEVIYQEMSTEEYLRLSQEQDKVYSTLEIIDPDGEVKAGDFAVVCVVKDFRENVLSVPKGALRREGEQWYVYVNNDGDNVHTNVRIGMTDGEYTEVLSGIEPGDRILYADAKTPGENVVTLEKGDFHGEFGNRAYMYYPSSTYVKNPVEYGTAYYGTSMVRTYQHVEKGDVLATLRVVADELGLERSLLQKQRLEERIADLLKYDKDNSREQVEALREQLAEVEELIAKQRSDFATTEIVADRTGIIIWMNEMKEEDLVQKNANIAQIADESKCYVVVEDTKHVLQYGNEVSISFENKDKQQESVAGMVTSMSSVGVSKALQSDNMLILLPADRISDMTQTASQDEGWWSRYRYQVQGNVRNMQNIVKVPSKAVWKNGNTTYCFVVDEQGNKTAQSFIAGGYNTDFYWVIEGLEEGMKVCLN